MIYVKTHRAGNGDVVAICDEGLIGRVLEDGDISIDLKSYADFYKGDLIPAKDLSSVVIMETVASANVVGREAVKAAVETGIINKGNVKTVSGIPYAHAYRVD